ncbi:MAG: hypothetical protein HYZ53_17880 [Planctomycetes bacterium]|nr:hypothetical protein [Planctomycetota bacterium]
MSWKWMAATGGSLAGFVLALSVYGKDGSPPPRCVPKPASVFAAQRLPARAEVEAWEPATAREIRCAPYRENGPGVRLEVPASWTWTPSEADPRPAFPRWQRLGVARGTEPADAGAAAVVRGSVLPREVSLFEVLLRETEVRQLTILDRCGPPRFGPATSMDLIARGRSGPQPQLFRLRAFKDGEYLFLVEVSAPEATYAARREIMERVAGSSALLNPTARPYAEDLSRFTLPGPMAISTEVPVSFRSDEADAQTGGRTRLRLRGLGDPRFAGYLEFLVLDKAAFPAHNEEVLVYEQLQRLGEFGATVEDLRAERDTQPTGQFPGPGRFCVFACLKDGVECEAVILIRSNGKAWVVMTLFGPARREAPELWMANRRGLDVADHLLRAE